MLSIRKEQGSSKACAIRIERRAEGLARDAEDTVVVIPS